MEKGDLAFLNQLVDSYDKALKDLEKAYKKKRPDEFNKIKKIILDIQRRISREFR